MTFQLVLFYVFSAILLTAAVNVVMSKNPVHAALFLVLAFFTSACLWMLMQAEFLALLLVLVYVGAVMVLFLFVVMMIDIDLETMRQGFWRHLPVALIVGALMAIQIVLILVDPKLNLTSFGALPEVAADVNNVRDLGLLIYTQYLLPFELAAVLLLLAIVAAIALAHRKRETTNNIDVSAQVRVRSQDRLRMVKMTAERPEAPAADVVDANAGSESK
ncbi:MAG: NADH-quinone oxidoreductase subunit J [Neisseriaceae bacterium]|nr:NADH-quinone oxidoreductase subunit J [Neisseriaceae bacterium]MBP6862360.1 NADH-quinone oxidoreductase subunit J [Neisseriaceae bacterium]